MRQEDAGGDLNEAWEMVTYAFERHMGPQVIAAQLGEYVLGLAIAGRQADVARWTPVAQMYATLANAHSTEMLRLVVSDIRDGARPDL
jgi:hypothetical protein